MEKNTTQKGFSLLELSIVLTILGLLSGGIVAGQSLVEQAKMRSFVSDFNNTLVAHNAFKLKYGKMPGDFDKAQDYWGGATTANGDGDGRYPTTDGITDERVYYWHHLTLARMTETNFAEPDTEAKITELGRTSPVYDIAPTATFMPQRRATGSARYGIEKNYFTLATWYDDSGTFVHRQGSVTPQVAYDIDLKMDDGSASSGTVVAYNQSAPSGGADCVDGGYAAADYGVSTYELGEIEPTCRFTFFLE